MKFELFHHTGRLQGYTDKGAYVFQALNALEFFEKEIEHKEINDNELDAIAYKALNKYNLHISSMPARWHIHRNDNAVLFGLWGYTILTDTSLRRIKNYLELHEYYPTSHEDFCRMVQEAKDDVESVNWYLADNVVCWKNKSILSLHGIIAPSNMGHVLNECKKSDPGNTDDARLVVRDAIEKVSKQWPAPGQAPMANAKKGWNIENHAVYFGIVHILDVPSEVSSKHVLKALQSHKIPASIEVAREMAHEAVNYELGKLPPSNTIKPEHYKNGGDLDTLEAMQRSAPDMARGFMAGNVVKYVSRYQNKNGIEDLEKASEYLKRLIDFERQSML